MEEIKVGEYVRIDRGVIAKVKEIRLGTNKEKKIFQNIYELDNGLWTVKEYIINHSFNIIDLIEYDDVLEIFVNDNDIQKIVVYGDELYSLKIGELIAEDIKSIVTHEQFQSLEYRLEE